MKKDFLTSFAQLNCDVLCLQETKAQDEQVIEALGDMSEVGTYYTFTNSAVKKGYSGTAIITKTKPISVTMDMGIEEHDQEGRVICAEFDAYYLVTVYTPNSKNDLSRLPYRGNWDADFLAYLQALEEKKPVVMCGDLNAAHRDIDLARPKPNYNKSAGYTQQEIDALDNLESAGYVDTFRMLKPQEQKFSWWSYRAGARERNVGWRIDYFWASSALKEKVLDADIHTDVFGSDHCPVSVSLAID
ncbi:exodeoxyribonuclease III [Glaciecola sp. MH2013]|nr:exodeoxyribonuclease III [Glaciecola sp. MH2013]